MRAFEMSYDGVPKMREIYPFLADSTKDEVIALLHQTVMLAPDDQQFADACRLELLWRNKLEERAILLHGIAHGGPAPLSPNCSVT